MHLSHVCHTGPRAPTDMARLTWARGRVREPTLIDALGSSKFPLPRRRFKAKERAASSAAHSSSIGCAILHTDRGRQRTRGVTGYTIVMLGGSCARTRGEGTPQERHKRHQRHDYVVRQVRLDVARNCGRGGRDMHQHNMGGESSQRAAAGWEAGPGAARQRDSPHPAASSPRWTVNGRRSPAPTNVPHGFIVCIQSLLRAVESREAPGQWSCVTVR